MDIVRQLGCVICRNMGYDTHPDYTLIHHIDGKTKEGAHFKVLPLCDRHHSRYSVEGFHYNPTRWQARYGKQSDLLEQVLIEMDLIKENTI